MNSKKNKDHGFVILQTVVSVHMCVCKYKHTHIL